MDSKVILMPVSSRGDEIERLRGTLSDKPTTQEAADYLTKHGIFSEIQLLDENAASTSAALLELAAGQSCDLLVTGAYTLISLRHRLLGGDTIRMLKHAEIPVLMAH